MERKTRLTAGAAQQRRRRVTLLVTLAVIALIITLLVTEQVAILYVISTLSIVALLVIVGWSDLGAARSPAGESAPMDDSAAIGSNITAATTSFGAAAPPRGVRSK